MPSNHCLYLIRIENSGGPCTVKLDRYVREMRKCRKIFKEWKTLFHRKKIMIDHIEIFISWYITDFEIFGSCKWGQFFFYNYDFIQYRIKKYRLVMSEQSLLASLKRPNIETFSLLSVTAIAVTGKNHRKKPFFSLVFTDFMI